MNWRRVVRRCYNSTSECWDNRRKTFEPERGLENNDKGEKGESLLY